MTSINVSGSCLCGSVKYTIKGVVERFYHCHCSRCRKASGTGHASNLLVSPVSSINWTEGESLLSSYRVPEAARFFNTFCTRCGSPMPRVVPMLEGVLIPAGTLDDELPLKPQARIFWDSRANWSCGDDGLPVFSEYPAEIRTGLDDKGD